MSIPLPALSAGLLIPREPWNGRVVSLYSRALNLLHPEGVLVGLVAEPRQMSPYSALTPELFFSERAASLSVNTPCVFSDDLLTIGDLAVDFAVAGRWEGVLQSALTDSIASPLAIASLLKTAIAALGADDGLREVVVAPAKPTIFGTRARELLSRARVDPDGGTRELRGLSALVGLGIGFTPSGDDFISGTLLAERLTGTRKLVVDRDEIRTMLDRTNDGGRTLLLGALENRYPAYLLDLAARLADAARALPSGDAEAARMVEDAVGRAVRHGETSGTDAVTGLTWYLSLSGRIFEGI